MSAKERLTLAESRPKGRPLRNLENFKVMRRLLLAFRFLSIFPLGSGREQCRGGPLGPQNGVGRVDLKVDHYIEDELGRSTAFFPLVGLGFGLVLYITNRFLLLILPAEVVNVFLVLLWVTLSGGLHVDGLADTADGLFGSTKKTEALKIMKDSRSGVFGVIAIVSLLLLKVSLLGVLPGSVKGASLLIAPALGRWTVPLVALLFPAVREEGLGKIFSKSVGVFELVLASVTAVLIAVIFLKFASLFVLLGAVLFAVVLGFLITKRIGGMTGDTFGALIELTEVLVLLIVLILA